MNRSTLEMINTRNLLVCMLFVGSQFCVPVTAKANTAAPTTCTVEGMALYRDPVFVSSLHHTERDGSIREVTCAVETTQSLNAGDITIRLTLGRLHNGKIDDPTLNVKLIIIEKVDATGATMVGREFLGPDPLTGKLVFEPQAKATDDGILIRLFRRHGWIFRLQGNGLSPQIAFGWRNNLVDEFPQPVRDGLSLSVDLEKMEGRISVRARSNSPEPQFASAYGENRVLVAKLAWRQGALVAESGQTVQRNRDEEPFLDQISDNDDAAKKRSGVLPPGTEPCSLGAWSTDTDPKGLNVRAAPNAQAKVLGIVPPPRKLLNEHDTFGDEPAKSEFRIVGYQQGWFLIDTVKAPGVPYGINYPRNLPQPYQGRGWVSSRKVGAAYANGGLPAGNLYLSPHADASASRVVDSHGNPLGPDGSPSKILACSGWWGLVETKGGKRGWWRALCSNQVTNCS